MRTLYRWLSNPASLLALLLSLLPFFGVVIYLVSYSLNLPYSDQWNAGTRIALQVADGSLTFAELVRNHTGHRTFFNHLVTALLVVVTDWNIHVENLVHVGLAGGSVLLLALLLRRSRIGWVIIALPIFSALVFAISRNWLNWRHAHWTFANLFFLGALLALSDPARRWRSLLLAAGLAFCATFSMATGMLTWLVLLPLLPLLGYRDWRQMLFWLVCGAVAVGLYLSGGEIVAGEDAATTAEMMNLIQMPDLGFLAQFTLVYLARLFAGYQPFIDLMTVIGAAGIALLTANALYLWRKQRRAVVLWLAVAGYALAAGVLTGLGRAFQGATHAMMPQYIIASALFWCALAALMLASARAALAQPGRWGGLLLRVNLIAAVALGGLHLYSEASAAQQMSDYWQRSLTLVPSDDWRTEEACAYTYLFYHTEECIGHLIIRRYVPDQLATRRLAVYAHMDTRSILPPAYAPGSEIVIESDNIWVNVNIRDWLLAGVDEALVTHVAPFDETRIGETRTIPQPPQPILTAAADAEPSTGQVWHIRAETAEPTLTLTSDYLSVYETRIDAPLPLTITGYQRFDTPPGVLFRFGGWGALRWWRLRESVEVARCAAIHVESLWQVEQHSADNLSMTLVLADDTGVGVVRADGAPAGLETTIWQPEQAYLDARALTIPCDLPPGDYPLLVGIYDPGTGESLTAALPDETLVGGLVYLTTLMVK